MAAPSATARGTPSGILLKQGFPSKLTFANNTTLSVWEKKVKPPGLDGGEAIEQTTMFNTLYRTFAARTLITMTPLNLSGAYDPNLFVLLLAQINIEQVLTLTFPEGTTLAFYGYLQKADFNELAEGVQPEISLTIQPTNADPVTRAETAAVLVNVPGT